MSVKSIMIVGVGGQGSLLASKLLGKLLVDEGYDVKVSEVHGMSQRGGSVVTYVRFGDKVYSPVIEEGEADFIISFEKIEAARWVNCLKKGGKIIVNTQQIDPMPVIIGAAEYPQNVLEEIKAAGVDVDDIDIFQKPHEIFRAEVRGFIDAPHYFLEGDENEIAEKCFKSIEYCGLKLALPMKASDLPEGYSIGATYTATNTYNGFCLSDCIIYQDKSVIMNIQVLHKKGENVSEGQIVMMDFYSLNGLPKLGDGIILPDMSSKEICEIFNQDTLGKYVLENGSIIDFCFTDYDDYPPSWITLSCDGSGESY